MSVQYTLAHMLIHKPRNQYNRTLGWKKQGSMPWHEFKTEGSKILPQLRCQAKLSSLRSYGCLHIFKARFAASTTNEKGTVIWKQQLISVHTDRRSSTFRAVAIVLLFVDIEETLRWTTGTGRMAGFLLFIYIYLLLLKCHWLSQINDFAFCSLIFTTVQ